MLGWGKGERDDEGNEYEEVAIVCQEKEEEKGEDVEEASTKEGGESRPVQWVRHRRDVYEKRRIFHDLGVMIFMLLCLGLCIVFYIFHPEYMFGVLVVSACLCPFYNAMNAPLWLAILLLTISGWSFTTGSLSISWKSQSV